MAILTWTYTTLLAHLQAELEDDGAQLAASLDELISRGEQMLCDDLNLHLFDGEDTGSFVTGTATITRPTDAVDVQSVWYTDAGSDLHELAPRSLEFCRVFWPNSADQAAPRYWAPQGETSIYVAPTPDSTYAYRIVSRKRPTGLSASQATSWFGTHAADALNFACLVAAEQFMIGDERVPMWKDSYDMALGRLRPLVGRLVRIGYAPPVLLPGVSTAQ